MIDQYYEEELRYLYQSGREFARAHPDKARFLNIDAVGDRDPYVERLFEGFAFLAARVREKLDDSFPELTERLLDLMWPQLLLDIPSTAIVQFQARPGVLQETRTIPAGSEVLSGPVGPESTICCFRTTQDVPISPLTLAEVRITTDTRGKSTLHLRFRRQQTVPWESITSPSLRVYLHAEMPIALLLHEFLTRRLTEARLTTPDAGTICTLRPPEAVTAAGMSPSESLLPGDKRSFRGFALLREYFVCPEKFLFVDLHGVDRLAAGDPEAQEFTFSAEAGSALPSGLNVRAENFRLFCSPIVNLYQRQAEPVSCVRPGTEQRVVADSASPLSTRVHSVISVVGLDRSTGERVPYEPQHSFRNLGGSDVPTYTVHHRTAADGRRECLLAVGGARLRDGAMREQVFSADVWCTNGTLPREELNEGDVSRPGSGFPSYVSVANITRPTLPAMPPGDDQYLWNFLSHSAATATTLADADTLKNLLRVYNWSSSEARARRIESITEVTSQPLEKTHRGAAVRGIEFRIAVSESSYQDTSDLHLFGEVLHVFLSHYVSINCFLDLVIVQMPSGREHRWSSVDGTRWLI